MLIRKAKERCIPTPWHRYPEASPPVEYNHAESRRKYSEIKQRKGGGRRSRCRAEAHNDRLKWAVADHSPWWELAHLTLPLEEDS